MKKINIKDQELTNKIVSICSEDIHATPQDVAEILEISNDKVNALMNTMNANAPKKESPF
tara:strand:- start:802 stop:981 length:180 start_codon:yes stop_codon:yes gene_type:complete